MQKLEGKVALITGGSSGIGLAAAIELKKHGARVSMIGRNATTLAGAAEQLGGDVVTVQGDVANMADIERLVDETYKVYGKIDILFLNAGMNTPRPIEAMTEDFYYRIFDVNFKGAYFAIQKALPLMNNKGSIILTSSVAIHMGLHSMSLYTASKAALNSLAKSLATELAGRGIRVNSISPGYIKTPLADKTGLSREVIDLALDNAKMGALMQRLGNADEIARAVVFLASDDSSYMTGAEMVVDGGSSFVH